MNITDSPVFCPRPWSTIDMNQHGDIKVCPRNLYPIGNSSAANMDDIINGQVLKSMKESIVAGQWSDNCEYCRRLEDANETSERQHQLSQCSTELKSKINEDINIFRLTEAMINWGNLCNLSCNYCNGDFSTTWQLAQNKTFTLISVPDESIDWIIKNSEFLHSIMVMGGEPLLQKKLPMLLSSLTTQTQIAIPTNLSVPLETNPMFNAIIKNKDISPVRWYISFDGLGEKFEYVRHGAEWDLFKDNINILKKHNQQIIAHPVYGLYSAFDLEEYFDFCVTNDLSVFYGKMQYWPIESDIRYAPGTIIDLAIENIDRVIEKYKNKINLDELIDYRNMKTHIMQNSSYSNLSDQVKASKILEFIQHIENTLPKKKSFAELWPEVHNILLIESKGEVNGKY